MTLEELFAEIETTFSNYAETGDIDRVTIKTVVIQKLRKFGKNICEKRETIIDVKNSQALLPENFKSLHLALKLEDFDLQELETDRMVATRRYVENPAVFDRISNDYIVNHCDTKVITEYIRTGTESIQKYYLPQFLSLQKGIQKDTLDVDCLNLHPSIRETYPHTISITNRALRTNFKEGKIYIQYNSLPVDEDGEITIPEITTGDIRDYILNEVKIKIAEELIANNKNPTGLSQLFSMYKQENRNLFIAAKSEANWNGLGDDRKWATKMHLKNRQNMNIYNLPRR